MRRPLQILSCAAWLAGCAAPGTPVATCTNLISTAGGLLQFCQRADKLRVSESGIDPARDAGDVRIVNDPSVLHALEKEIRPRPGLASSRSLVAHACVVKGRTYVSIAAADLRRIVDGASVDRPEVIDGASVDRPEAIDGASVDRPDAIDGGAGADPAR